MLGLILAVSPPPAGMTSSSVIDAERAYAAMAQQIGQWSAFRATATPGAIMFTPDPVDAGHWLQGRKDPSTAIKWQPAAAFISCDRQTAVTTGPWQYSKSTGFFATVWNRQDGAWRWAVDFGGGLDQPLPPAPLKVPMRRASCRKADFSRLPAHVPAVKSGSGGGPDKSLQWGWQAEKDGSPHLTIYLWNGWEYELVIDKRS